MTIAQSWLPEFLAAFDVVIPGVTLDRTGDISFDLRDAQLGLAFLMGSIAKFTVQNFVLAASELHRVEARDRAEVDPGRMPVFTASCLTEPAQPSR